MDKKICLFTAHSPLTGGGAVILRSLINNLPELSFQWKYLAEKPAMGYEQGYMGNGIMGSSIMQDIFDTWRMLTNRQVNRVDEIVNQLLQIDCDAYWIVSHNEGLRVAIELSRRQKKRPVHLTVHDDWAGALSARSIRYRLMDRLAKRMTIEALLQVDGVDLISEGMQAYYYLLSKRRGEICHRYLPSNTVGNNFHSNDLNKKELNVGHIGSIYDKDDFIQFLKLLQKFGEAKGLIIKVNMWGYHPKRNDIPPQFLKHLTMHQDLPEDKAIVELAKCDFVYSMYPQSDKLSIFGQTSLPTKLSSYVQACRPIFGHGPGNSTLADFIKNTGTGTMWSSGNYEEGLILLQKIILFNITLSNWQKARDNYFGENNLIVMRRAFNAV